AASHAGQGHVHSPRRGVDDDEPQRLRRSELRRRAMVNAINEMLVSELKGELAKAGSCLLVGMKKMTVAQAEEIRREFRKAGLRYRVVKNRLARVAFAEHRFDLGDTLKGQCGVVFAPQERA